MNQIIDIGGLQRKRFITDLQEITEPAKDYIVSALEYCRKIDAAGGEMQIVAQTTMNEYMAILSFMFPETYAELFGQ